ncbi:MAG: GAF domain-containing protein [Clostridia bacterium]|nr:GAF domain-containing protein [Clostridia bacterium]
MHQSVSWPQEKAALYDLLSRQLSALAVDCPPVSVLANAAALLWEAMPDINWAGFYLLKGDLLHLGPFQGKIACTQIPLGRGVCGTAASTRQLQLVPDVEQFPGHIACDSASRSEIVIPIVWHEKLIGVLDIDAPILARFDEEDARGLSSFVNILTEQLDWSKGIF